jgi:hypothetical protein
MSLIHSVIVSGLLSAPAEYSCPAVPDVSKLPYPRITATPAELGRLRAAYESQHAAERDIVANKVHEADVALERPLRFPPRGGQHNQWYQCEVCQLALKPIDATHHQCPRCQKAYSGEPYDDVVYSKIHSSNLKAMLAMAWAFAVTGEEKYARSAADVLLGYAERYEDYPYHSAYDSTSSRPERWSSRNVPKRMTASFTHGSCCRRPTIFWSSMI